MFFYWSLNVNHIKMLSSIKKLLPKPIYQILNSIRRSIKQRKNKRIRNQKIISQKEVLEVLNKLNIDSDVFLHTSLRNIGYEIEGGKKFVAETIMNLVTSRNYTLLCAALPFGSLMKDALEEHPFIDMRTAPNMMGAVNRIITETDGMRRSLHPSHSVVAIGKNADEYTKDHHIDETPFGPNSPYYKLMLNKGKILMFGVTVANMTFTHVVEDLLGNLYPMKVYLDKKYEVTVRGFDGIDYHVKTACHNPDVSNTRKCTSVLPDLIEAAVIKTEKLGLSEVSLLDAIGYIRVVSRLLLQGKSIYGPVCLTEEGRLRVHELLQNLDTIENH